MPSLSVILYVFQKLYTTRQKLNYDSVLGRDPQFGTLCPNPSVTTAEAVVVGRGRVTRVWLEIYGALSFVVTFERLRVLYIGVA